MILEEMGEYEQANALRKLAREEIYTQDANTSELNLIDSLIEKLRHDEGFIVDLASGMGGLVFPMAKHLPNAWFSRHRGQ